MTISRAALVSLVTMISMGTVPAFAQHDRPAKAKSLKVELVRAYEACTAPNTTDPNGNPACSPPTVPPSCIVELGPKGAGSVQLGASKGGIKYAAKLSDVLLTADGSAYGGPMTLQMSLRVTSTICGPSCTTPDTLLSIPLECDRGKCSAKGEAAAPTGKLANVQVGAISLLECGQLAPFTVQGLLLP